MNPQNMGTHISQRHSLLWRKKMFQQSQVPHIEGCHKQLNEIADVSRMSWRSRNNFIQTNFSQNTSSNSSWRKATRSVVINNVLAHDKRENQATKSMIKSLAIDADKLQKSQRLVQGMQELKKMRLLTGKSLQKTCFPGIIKHQHIYNDYHTRETNPGFSRNYMGKFYTK